MQVGLKNRLRATARVARWVSSAAGSISSGIAWVGSSLIGGALWLTGANTPLKEGEEPGEHHDNALCPRDTRSNCLSRAAGFLSEVSHASAVGVGSVWTTLEEAGRTVLTSARDGSADVVKHRCGC